MLGVNEALRKLKRELELLDAVSVNAEDGYVAMEASNTYFGFRPVEAFFKSQEQCELKASTVDYYRFPGWDTCMFDGKDRMNLGVFMSKEKPKEWERVKSLSEFIEKSKDMLINTYKERAAETVIHFYDSKKKKDEISKFREESLRKGAEWALKPAMEAAEDVNHMLNQVVNVGDKACVEVCSELGGLTVHSGNSKYKEYFLGVTSPKWKVTMNLLAEMPSKVEENHPLVSGVSKNVAFIDLSLPSRQNPEIKMNIRKSSNDPSYVFSIKDSGISEATLQNAINLLLL